MPTTAPPPRLEHDAARRPRVRAWAVATFQRELRDQALRRGVEERPRHRATDVVHDDVDPPELLLGHVGQAGDGVEVAQVGRHDHGPAAEGLDLRGDGVELLLGARGQQHVGAGLGECEGGGGADAAPGAGDDGHLVVESEAILDHPGSMAVAR